MKHYDLVSEQKSEDQKAPSHDVGLHLQLSHRELLEVTQNHNQHYTPHIDHLHFSQRLAKSNSLRTNIYKMHLVS